jgi:putative transcriptional regulator
MAECGGMIAGTVWALTTLRSEPSPGLAPLFTSVVRREKAAASGEALGHKLLQSIREMQAGQRARETVVEPNEVARSRQSIGLSRAQFAEALHNSKRALQEWEQGPRSPSGAAKAFIQIAKKHPKVVREALA